MIIPIRAQSYKFNRVPLTTREKKTAKLKGMSTEAVRGVFRFKGFAPSAKGSNKKLLIFQQMAVKHADGLIYAGRSMAISVEDFDVGIDSGKITGPVKVLVTT